MAKLDLLGGSYGYPPTPALGPQTFIPGEGLPMLQDGSSPVGSAPGEEWLDRLKSAGEKYRALQAFLDQAQGVGQDESIVEGPVDPMDPEGPTPKDGPQMIPGYGVAIAGLADLILGREEDYDPFTELPPDKFPSMLDKVAKHNQAAQAFRVGERHRREDRGEDVAGQRSRERNVLLGTLLPHILKDDDDKKGTQQQAEKIQSTWEVVRGEPWYQALPDEEKRRILLDIAGVSEGREPDKTLDEIRQEAEARAEGAAIGADLGKDADEDKKDPLADKERDFYTKRYDHYLTKGEGGGLFSAPLSPGEAHKRAMVDVEQWRQGVGRPAGVPAGSRGPRSSGGMKAPPGSGRDFDTEGHLFVGEGGEIIFPEDQGGGELGDLSDPRVMAAYQTLQGMRGQPPQPSAAMSGFGDVREREAQMGGMAPMMGQGPGIGPPPMPQGAPGVPPGAPPAQPGNLMKALAGFHLYVAQNPGTEEKARLKFYDKYGVDPYELEQAPGPGR